MKSPRLKNNIISILLILFTLGYSSLSAQYIDSSFINNEKKLFSSSGIDSFVNTKTQSIYNSLRVDTNELIKPFQKGKSLLSKLKVERASYQQTISAKYEYINNSYLPNEVNGHYSRNSIQNNFSVGALPFNLSLNFDVHNNKVLFHYNILSLNINKDLIQTELNQLQQSYLSDYKNYSTALQQQIFSMKDSLLKMDNLTNMVQDTGYFAQLKKYKDQYQTLADSNKRGPVDTSLMMQYLDTLKKINSNINAYAGLSKYITDNKYVVDSIKQNQEWLEKLKSNPNVSEVKGVPEQLLQSVTKNKKLNLLSRIENLSLGKGFLQHGTILINQQSLFGANLEMMVFKKFFLGVGAGLLNNSFNFLDYNSYRSSLQNKNVFAYTALGVGKKSNTHLHFILFSYNNFPNATAVPVYTIQSRIRANAMIGLDYLQKINDAFTVRAELSFAGSSISSRDASYNPFYQDSVKGNRGINPALKISAMAKIKKTKTNITGGVQFISPKYFSVGNPFAIPNSLNANLNFVQPLFKGKLNLQSTYAMQRMGVVNNSNPQTQLLMRQSSTAQLSSIVTLQNDYNFTGILLNGKLTGAVHQLASTLSLRYALDKKGNKANTTLNLSYTTMNMNNGETPSNNINSIQSSVTQLFSFSQSIQYSVAGNVILNDIKQPANLTYGVSSKFSATILKKFVIANTERFVTNSPQNQIFTSDVSLRIPLYKKLQLELAGVYTMHLGNNSINTAPQIRATAGLSYGWGINYENKKIKVIY